MHQWLLACTANRRCSFVVELIKGIDFRLTSAGSQITQRADETFETERARLAGLAATEEVYGDVDPTIVAAGRWLKHTSRGDLAGHFAPSLTGFGLRAFGWP